MSDSTSILGVSISKCSIKMQSERERTRVNFRPVTAQPIINNAPRHRREAIPHKPAKAGLDLWGVLRNCIGKDLTRIPLPVSFNEPLSMLQRITEDLDYSYLLDQAAEKDDICERLAYVGAYAVSCYSTTARRIAKPFNPLLGETFEFDRRQDLGWRSLAEQVSHHPPEAAHHADGLNWMMHQDLTINCHFRGHLNVVPVGFTHVKFRDGKAACSYQKVSTNVHNIILGNLWIENQGTMTIVNHVSGERAIIKFCGHNMFSPTREKKIKGVVLNKRGEARFCLKGYWDTHVNIGPVVAQKMKGNKLVIEAGESHTVWAVNKPITDHTMYNFTKLALELNEPNDEAVAPTDSRRRPDQRSMENGRWDEANRLKERLEQKQREAHKLVEDKAEKNGQDPAELLAQPRWFKKIHDQNTDTAIHLVLNQEYWECKERQDWSRCPDIF